MLQPTIAAAGKVSPADPHHAIICYVQDKDGPKALDEFCRDLCEEVRMNKIDPVSGPLAATSWNKALLWHMQQDRRIH